MNDSFSTNLPPFFPDLLHTMDQFYAISSNNPAFISKPGFQTAKALIRKPKLRILYVTFLRYPNTGGLAHYINHVKDGFSELDYHVDVLSPLSMSKEELEIHIPVQASKAKEFMSKRYGLVSEKIVKNTSFLTVFNAFLEKQNLKNYDIIHAQDLFAAYLLAHLNQKLHKPIFFTPHGHFTKSRIDFYKMQQGSLEEAYFTAIERAGIRGAFRIITISDSFHPRLKELGASNQQLRTVHTGVKVPSLRTSYSKATNKLVITCIARLGPRKGHEFFLQALSHLKQFEDYIEVWIVGDGVMRKHLEKIRSDLDLSFVTFFGKRHDVFDILQQSDIYVLPTLNDNLPLSIIEAMHAKQAIITCDCGGIPEIVTNRHSGLVCKPGNVAELKQALEELICNAEYRKTIANQAFEFATTHLTADVMIAKIQAVYEEWWKTNTKKENECDE
ncbi:glycosyltransferase family 4 protein [Priestia flexa]|uniref:glycosyltransferase family 4 protein n=1 Tax=Priestia flexa TaxID=86664 RepID=UPI0009C1C211|nr:glycosyltransferase family 4 protein [Priestia flexa]AQX54949.1 hypothetical protein BC359_11955 [Priestia flexa]MCM3067025.1 glycosyltransferase family 4 protein [Priestia flexa]MCP1189218.1 glycosyltransferase family 4 protein [Priestia flexa]MED4591030.1 glycosyltransferase family 4 protein [Priestia flexa]QCS53218.1 glycosyltransferase family 4 protein [Priestia flexa]